MKNLISVVISFILIVSIASAVDFPASITKIGESGVVGGTFKLSSDGKYLYVCNGKGHFSKFDIEKALVTDTLQLQPTDSLFEPFFDVDVNNKYLFYSRYNSLIIYDLYLKEQKKSFVHLKLLGGYGGTIRGRVLCNTIDSLVYVATDENSVEGTSYFIQGLVYTYNPYTDKIINKLMPNFGVPVDGISFSNDNKYFLMQGNEKQIVHYRDENRMITLHYGLESASFDNSENLYLQRTTGELRVFSLKDSNWTIAKSKTNERYLKYVFVSNNRYYIGYKKDLKFVLVFDKWNHNLADTILIDDFIRDVKVAPDSISLFILTKSGSLVNVSHPLLSDSIFINFTQDKQINFVGDSIKIYDITPGTYDSRAWYVNNVKLSDTNRTAVFVPVDSGYFDVELVLTKNGLSQSKKKERYLNVKPKVKADFDVIIKELDNSLEVQFMNKSTGEELEYSWYFGDSYDFGSFSTLKDPIHKFNKNRLYSVTLIAKNQFTSDTAFKKSIIKYNIRSLDEITEYSNYNSLDDRLITPFYCKKLNDSNFYYLGCFHVIRNYKYGTSIDPFSVYYTFNKHNSSNSKDNMELFMNSMSIDDSLFLMYHSIEKFSVNKINYIVKNFFTDLNLYASSYLTLLQADSATFKLSLLEFFSANNNEIGVFAKYKSKNVDYCRVLNCNKSMKVTKKESISLNPIAVLRSEDNSMLAIVTPNNNKYLIYSYTKNDGLKELFNIPKIENIRHFDYNPRYNTYLFAYDVLNGKDSSSEFLLYKSDGTLVRKVELSQINSIKFCENTIIVAPYAYKTIERFVYSPNHIYYGNKLISIYDYRGNFLSDYYDNNFLGEFLSIIPLNNSRALLFGSRVATFEYTYKFKYTWDIIYYFINLKDIEVGIINDDDENSDSPVSLKVYPNPTTESVTVFFENDSSQTAQVMVLNSSGNEVFETTTNLEYFMANTSSLGIGTYYIQIRLNDGKTLNGKFVKVK